MNGKELQMMIQSRDNQPELVRYTESNPFRAELFTWLQNKPQNTRRSYIRGVDDFFSYWPVSPAEITSTQVAIYKEHLKTLGRKDSTVAQRLAALSSYYQHLMAAGLVERNPVDLAGRDDLNVSPYERSRKVSAGDFRKLLAAIDVATAAGAMYAALFQWYYLSGHRRSEPLRVTGGDIRQEGGRITYRVETKGGRVKWREMPPPVWLAIQHYLALAGRQLVDDEPIFQATTDNGEFLREWRGETSPAEPRPLSDSAASQALKRYAAAAGLNPEKVSLHSLRHLAAESYYKASGKDVEATRQFLGHASLNTTTIYLNQLEGAEHRHWQAMMNSVEAATD